MNSEFAKPAPIDVAAIVAWQLRQEKARRAYELEPRESVCQCGKTTRGGLCNECTKRQKGKP